MVILFYFNQINFFYFPFQSIKLSYIQFLYVVLSIYLSYKKIYIKILFLFF